jgi:hypothetical protein
MDWPSRVFPLGNKLCYFGSTIRVGYQDSGLVKLHRDIAYMLCIKEAVGARRWERK